MARRILSPGKGVQSLLGAGLLCRNRDGDVAGRTGFAGIVCGLRAAG
jgi:hypothetical protein